MAKTMVAVTGLEGLIGRRLLRLLPEHARVMTLEALADTPVRRVVHVSSTRVYGANPRNPAYLREDDGLAEQEPRLPEGATILRIAPLIGPTIDSPATHFFGRRLVPAAPGFDPLLQFLHEDDLALALKMAVESKRSGVFNITGDGVIPLSTVCKLVGARRVPLPIKAPIDLRWPCVADNDRAKQVLGFAPQFTSADAVLDFAQTLRLRRLAA